MRINRYLASAGLGSRRSCEALVLSGAVRVNSHVAQLATVVAESDRVTVNGRPVEAEPRKVLALHKPKGFICSREDLAQRKTIFYLLPHSGPRLFYVGRLDMDSEGLLIVTNDGDLCQSISHPAKKVPKTYEVGLTPAFDAALIPKLTKGFMIEPGQARMDSVEILNPYLLRVVLSQGLKRQIRLMFGKLGFRVKHLKRTHIGGLELGTLRPGEFRSLNARDLKRIYEPARPPVRARPKREDQTLTVARRSGTRKYSPRTLAHRDTPKNETHHGPQKKRRSAPRR
ncbi:MAG: pseudouridine synthase [Candidatus Methylacidiphilales bacterium]